MDVGATTVTVDILTVTSYDAVVIAIQAAIDAVELSVLTVQNKPLLLHTSIDVDGYSAGQLAGNYNPILIT